MSGGDFVFDGLIAQVEVHVPHFEGPMESVLIHDLRDLLTSLGLDN